MTRSLFFLVVVTPALLPKAHYAKSMARLCCTFHHQRGVGHQTDGSNEDAIRYNLHSLLFQPCCAVFLVQNLALAG
jgi:hypothetical protein